ncbi:lipopolysaccharide biosynthesis protein [Enterococcus rivorum]|uniref:Polysaccharide biosynthesis protein n=1 Tax=Enterococcus rivorum TaxID=762845 RepID=A0A1E5KSD5_9ENTE|nr:oligosaccharide flippase family protein [Enterococcus rivorum]MBP2097437.1 O-antigen/teichoic acid export membrane protein [Enterococcus rivorum]OEH80780.1 polysaccharide biosynthesis protein [Enterococcus rivorum]
MNTKTKRNFAYQALYQLSLMLLPIVSIPIVSEALGPSGLGTWNYINSIANYFILFGGLGLANYGVKEITIVKENNIKLSQKFWELQLFNLFFSLGSLTLYLMVASFTTEKYLFFVQAFAVLSTTFDISWFFAGIEDFKKISIINILIKVISLLGIILFVHKASDVSIYFWIQTLSLLASQLLLWPFLVKKISFQKIEFKNIWVHFKPSLAFFLVKISLTIFTNLNKTILGLFTSSTIVGIFSNSLVLVLMSGSIINALNVVMLPHMSTLSKQKRNEEMIAVLKRNLDIQFFLTIAIMFGIIAINNKMIPWFFGDEFSQMKYVVPLVAPTVIFQPIYGSISHQYLIPKGRIAVYNTSMLIGAGLLTISGLILVPIIGIYGAVASNFIGHFYIFYSRMRHLKKEESIDIEIKKKILSGILMLVIVVLSTKYLQATYITTIVQVMIGIPVYFILTSLLKVNPFYKNVT